MCLKKLFKYKKKKLSVRGSFIANNKAFLSKLNYKISSKEK